MSISYHTQPLGVSPTHPSSFRFVVEISVGSEVKQCNQERMELDDWNDPSRTKKWEGGLATKVMKEWGPGWEAKEFVLQCKRGLNDTGTQATIEVKLTSEKLNTSAVCGNVLLFVSAKCSVR